MSSPDFASPVAEAEALRAHAGTLLAIARASIRHGLAEGRPLPVAVAEAASALQRIGASFVTLELDGALRGCTGTPYARRPLIADVAENAFASAFCDPRFAPLTAGEFARVETEISVLTPPRPIAFSGEEDLLARLRPGEDGLLLECDGRRGLFLPQVWEAVPDRRTFLAHLKAKAGLPPGPLAPEVRALGFAVVKLTDEDAGGAG